MAKAQPSKPAAKQSAVKTTVVAKDPRTSGDDEPQGGKVVEEHAHDTAMSARRRKLDDDDTAKLPAAKEDKVTVKIPRGYNLQVLKSDGSGSQIVRYEAGVDEMPRSHAEHDYSKAHGVEIIR